MSIENTEKTLQNNISKFICTFKGKRKVNQFKQKYLIQIIKQYNHSRYFFFYSFNVFALKT